MKNCSLKNSEQHKSRVRIMVFNDFQQQYFSYIMVSSFIGGGIWRTGRKPPQITDQLYHLKCQVLSTLLP
jgi:hypothetical protein